MLQTSSEDAMVTTKYCVVADLVVLTEHLFVLTPWYLQLSYRTGLRTDHRTPILAP